MTQEYRPIAAAFWMIGSVLSFSIMAVAGRSISDTHDTFEIMAARSILSLAILLVILLPTGRLREVGTDRIGQHALRNLIHFSGQNLWFQALFLIPLAQVFALEFTSPIWVVLLAPIFLGETLTRVKILAAGLGFAGTLIVAQPDFNQIDIGVLAGAAAAFCFAATNIATKSLTRHESVISILFWLTLMQSVLGMVSAGYDGDITLPTARTFPVILLIAITGLTAHYSLTKALSLAPASVAVPVDFIRLPIAALLGWWLYHEVVSVNVWLGGAMIIAAVWINLRASKPRLSGHTPRQISEDIAN